MDTRFYINRCFYFLQGNRGFRKTKRKADGAEKKLKDVLIPLCCSIEEAIDAMDQYKSIKIKDFDIKLWTPPP